MIIRRLVVAVTLAIALTGCESGGLGMKITVTEKPVPSSIPDTVAEAKAGELTIVVASGKPTVAKAGADALAAAFATEDVPAGTLTFTKLSIRTRSQHDNPRGSGEIDATCIWQEAGEGAVCYDVRLRTFSIEIEDFNTQLKYLKDEAVKGLARELADTF